MVKDPHTLISIVQFVSFILYTLCTVYLLSVYVCTFDVRQHVVFISKLFEFEFDICKLKSDRSLLRKFRFGAHSLANENVVTQI